MRAFILSSSVVVSACSANAPAAGSQTWMVDCVAVLGAPPPSAEMPLEGVPYSGASRDARIGELTDEELARLCDFDSCMDTNGYRHDCCGDMYCTPPDESFGTFRLGTSPLLADAMSTCYQTSFRQATNGSRESDMALYRLYFGACHVARWEDCTRELAVDPLGAAGQGADCAERNSQCGAGGMDDTGTRTSDE